MEIKNINTLRTLLELLQDKYEDRYQQLNGNGILDLNNIQYAPMEDGEFEKVKDIITNNIDTFVILYAYGSSDMFLFSKEPESTSHTLYENFKGHGTSIILNNLPKEIFIYGEDD